MSDDDLEGRCSEINAAIRRESRPTRMDNPHTCPVCREEPCFGEKCVKCWKVERDEVMRGSLAED